MGPHRHGSPRASGVCRAQRNHRRRRYRIEKAVGVIHTSGYTHGIAIVPSYGVGFATVGKSTASKAKPQHEVDVFDLKTLKIVKRISVQDDPDAITYDAVTHRIYVANADPAVATVIDVPTKTIVKTVPLGGHPEFPIGDGLGHVFYNMNDTNKVVVFDSRKATIVKRFSLGACDGPTAIAYDAQARRLLIPCDNGKLVILDATSGDVVATLRSPSNPTASLGIRQPKRRSSRPFTEK